MLQTYADKNTPFSLSPESLDRHLARGWYRMGSTIFTTHFLFFNQQPYSAVWIRYGLADFEFSKSQRKLLRRNAKLFAVRIGPRVIDAEHEALYQRYAADFDGRLSPTIAESLEDYDGEVVFNTYEITIRERVSGRLVACSYFDLGGDSAASILGIYDPALSTFSLGYYTMLLEMEYCLANTFNWYYPGYVVPGYQRFDYKLRLGPAEYYDVRSDGWQPYSLFNPQLEAPVEAQRVALTRFLKAFAHAGFKSQLLVYPLFEAGLYDIWNDDYFPYPYLVPVAQDKLGGAITVVAFDPRTQSYYLLDCLHMVQTQMLFNAEYLSTFSEGQFMTDLIAVRQVLLSTKSPTVVALACKLMQRITTP